MSIESTFYNALQNDATLTTLVGSRIYPQVAPDGAATPYITYQVVVGTPHNRNNGAAESERKLIQVNCISNSYTNAKDIAVACKAAINGTVGYLNSENDDYFYQTENHRVRLDFALIG